MVSMKPNIWQRRRARRALVQALYKWHLTKSKIGEILSEFLRGPALAKADQTFFGEILTAVVNNNPALQTSITVHLDRSYARLDFVEQSILELATHELQGRKDIPYRVVIDEYVELAKTFGAQDSYKYVNAVLDKISADCRNGEAV